jgi:hypothetical protein
LHLNDLGGLAQLALKPLVLPLELLDALLERSVWVWLSSTHAAQSTQALLLSPLAQVREVQPLPAQQGDDLTTGLAGSG